jgi:hypothetical protein
MRRVKLNVRKTHRGWELWAKPNERELLTETEKDLN